MGTPYASARRQLITQGFEPAHIVSNGNYCGGRGDPACTSERIICAADIPACQWLFVRRSDNALFVVSTGSELDAHGRPIPPEDGYVGIRTADRATLEGLVVLLPNGRRKSFVSPPPPYRAPLTPLCSENGGRIPCWIKPPADAPRATPEGARPHR
jgi:hypothetical protein